MRELMFCPHGVGDTQLHLDVLKGSPGITPAWPVQGSGDTGMGCQVSRLFPDSSLDKACCASPRLQGQSSPG